MDRSIQGAKEYFESFSKKTNFQRDISIDFLRQTLDQRFFLAIYWTVQILKNILWSSGSKGTLRSGWQDKRKHDSLLLLPD